MTLTIPNGVADAFKRFKNFIEGGPPPTGYWLLARWGRALFRYATHVIPPYEFDQNPPLVPIRQSILDAMEIFVLGHECGHHVAQGQNLTTETLTEENQADIIGRFVSMAVAKVRNHPFDYFLIAGAGAPLALGAMEMLLRAKQVLRTGDDKLPVSETHPTLARRLHTLNWAEPLVEFAAIKELHRAGGPDGKKYIEFRYSLEFILAVIWRALKPSFVNFHQDKVRPMPDATDNLGRLGL